jgi:hypothetical protein
MKAYELHALNSAVERLREGGRRLTSPPPNFTLLRALLVREA